MKICSNRDHHCYNCKHGELDLDVEPCKSCVGPTKVDYLDEASNWIPKDPTLDEILGIK